MYLNVYVPQLEHDKEGVVGFSSASIVAVPLPPRP
jgi:hypothetical protein